MDIKKLRTVANYANSYGVSRQSVYKAIKEGKVKTVIIDGVTFVKV
jgi:DNA-binding phage protein